MWPLSVLVRLCMMFDYCNLSCIFTKPSFYHLVHGCTQIFKVSVNAHKLQAKQRVGEEIWVQGAAVGPWKSQALGFWVWGPEPGEELAVGSSSRVRFPWAGEEEQGRVVNTLCVSAPCVHRDADKGTVFLSVFDLSGHLSLLLSRCMSVCQCWEHHQLGLGMWNCSSPVSVTKGDEDTPWFPRVA